MVESKGGEFMMIGRRSIICLIGVYIVIGFVSQAQLSQKDESGSPLYEYRAAPTAEGFGLAPSGSANSDLEFGSVATADLTVQTKQPPPPPLSGQHCPTPHRTSMPHTTHRTSMPTTT
jgi:hypothetical protein